MYSESQKNQKQLPRSLEWFLLIYNFKLFLLFLLKEKFRRQSLVWGGGLSEIMQGKLETSGEKIQNAAEIDPSKKSSRKERLANRKKYDPKTMEKSYGDQYSAEAISICYDSEAERYYYQNVFCANTKILAFRMRWYEKKTVEHTQKIIEYRYYCEIIELSSENSDQHKEDFKVFFRNLQNLEANDWLLVQKSAQELSQARQQFDSLRNEIAQSLPKFPTS